MRQLIDTSFRDETSYSTLVSGDTGMIVIDHPYGPANKINTLAFDQFQFYYPALKLKEMSPSYINAYRAYQLGLGELEVVRHVDDSVGYTTVVFDGSSVSSTVLSQAEVDNLSKSVTDKKIYIALKYRGNPEWMYQSNTQLLVDISVNMDGAVKDGVDASGNVVSVPDITVSLIRKVTTYTKEWDSASEKLVDKSVDTYTTIEEVTGALQAGANINGENYDIGSKLMGCTYMQGFIDYDTEVKEAEDDGNDDDTDGIEGTAYRQYLEAQSLVETSSDDLASFYYSYFKSIETSQGTIAIDPGTTSQEYALNLITLAEYRQNCTALVGYPTAADWDVEKIITYFQGCKTSMFAAGYAIRETVEVGGRKYLCNGMGSVAGKYAAIAADVNVNQLPSAKTYGQIALTLSQSFEFDDVLELHEAGVNTCYNSVDGARLFGLRSLYSVTNSYFAKFNVARTIARILQYAFNVAIDAIHTGNTDSRKKQTQNLLQQDLNRLIGDEALRSGSYVRCDDTNNHDLDTNGGEILVIDYTCYFVKLIERVKISITATDNSVNAEVAIA